MAPLDPDDLQFSTTGVRADRFLTDGSSFSI